MTDWPMKTLGEVCDFVRGVTYDKADARSVMKNGFIPLLRATNITEKGLLREDFVFVPSDGVRADQKLISGDALITIASGSASVVGRSVLVEDPGEMTFGAFCGVLRPSPEILPKYLSHFMSSRSVRTAWSEAAQGTNINNLKRDDILQTECLLPPLEEQKRIVALLDAATARVTELTACYEQARTHANDLFTSALCDALEENPGWSVKSLGAICEVFDDGDWIESKDQAPSGVRLIQTGNVGDGEFKDRSDKARFISESTFARLRCTEIFPGDLLVSRLPDPVGRACLIPDTGSKMITAVDCTIMRPRRDIMLPQFLVSSTQTSSYREQVLAKITGTTRDRISRSHLAEVQVSVPTLEEQKRIVARLNLIKEKTSEMVAAYDAKLTAAKNLRQSILEAAFAGDL
jgi:type I restriction enzyme S subunit